MKIFESLASYRLSVILDDGELQKYLNAFRSGKQILITELGNKLFQVEKITPYFFGGGVPENSYELELKETLPPNHAIERDVLLKQWDVPMRSQ